MLARLRERPFARSICWGLSVAALGKKGDQVELNDDLDPGDPPDSEPDMFGAHEKWSEQSIELVRWVWPGMLSLIGAMGAAAFGLGFGDDPNYPNPWPLTVLGWMCVAFIAGCLFWTWLGGPTRVEVDQSLRSVKSIHARRFRPKTLTWHFDEIVELSVSMSAEIITTKDDGSFGSHGGTKEYDTYYVNLHLRDGSKVRLFGKEFRKGGDSATAHERLAKLSQLTGKREKKYDPREFEALRAKVESVLGKHP
jgi:hypothetical protein